MLKVSRNPVSSMPANCAPSTKTRLRSCRDYGPDMSWHGRVSSAIAVGAVVASLLLASAASEAEKVTFGYFPVADFLLTFIAKDQGFFEHHFGLRSCGSGHC